MIETLILSAFFGAIGGVLGGAIALYITLRKAQKELNELTNNIEEISIVYEE